MRENPYARSGQTRATKNDTANDSHLLMSMAMKNPYRPGTLGFAAFEKSRERKDIDKMKNITSAKAKAERSLKHAQYARIGLVTKALKQTVGSITRGGELSFEHCLNLIELGVAAYYAAKTKKTKTGLFNLLEQIGGWLFQKIAESPDSDIDAGFIFLKALKSKVLKTISGVGYNEFGELYQQILSTSDILEKRQRKLHVRKLTAELIKKDPDKAIFSLFDGWILKREKINSAFKNPDLLIIVRPLGENHFSPFIVKQSGDILALNTKTKIPPADFSAKIIPVLIALFNAGETDDERKLSEAWEYQYEQAVLLKNGEARQFGFSTDFGRTIHVKLCGGKFQYEGVDTVRLRCEVVEYGKFKNYFIIAWSRGRWPRVIAGIHQNLDVVKIFEELVRRQQ